MLNMTNAQSGERLTINPKHVVAIREDRGQVFILTSTGVEYAVKEDYDQIGKSPVWNYV